MRVAALALFLIFITGCHRLAVTGTAKPAGAGPLAIKSGRVAYHFSYGPTYGEKILVFDNYGALAKIYTTSRFDTALMAQKLAQTPSENNPFMNELRNRLLNPDNNETHQLVIYRPGEKILINTDAREGVRQSNTTVWPGADSLPATQTVLAGQQKIAGQMCTVQIVAGTTKLFKWNGLTLKTQALTTNGNTGPNEYAVDVDVNYTIRPGEFDIPADVVIK